MSVLILGPCYTDRVGFLRLALRAVTIEALRSVLGRYEIYG
jgi:hypothetical protein